QQASRMTIVFTTHLMEEADHAARLVILDQGRVVADGSPTDLKSQMGGDVIRIETPEPEPLRAAIIQKFGGEASIVDGTVRIERTAGHEFVPQVVEAFPGRILAVSVGKPTLEDVFIRRTGRRLYQENARA